MWPPLYAVGQTLYLAASDVSGNNTGAIEHVQVKITQLFEPYTTSCVLRVDAPDEHGKVVSRVLKIFDHRFAHEIREAYRIEPYTDVIDKNVRTYISERKGMTFHAELDEHEYLKAADPEEEQWTDAECELFVQKICHTMYKAEVATYGALEPLQGKDVPKCYGTFQIPWFPISSISSLPPADAHLSFLPAILLEYIPGYTLNEIDLRLPQDARQDVCNQAIRVVNACSDLNVLNKDVRPRNFVVTNTVQGREDTWQEKQQQQLRHDMTKESRVYKVYMIDFAQSRLRSPQESDSDWGALKHMKDEEGCIAKIMRMRLRSATGFELHYEASHRYLPWAQKE